MNDIVATVGGRRCLLYADGRPQMLLVQPVSEHQQDGMEVQLTSIHTAGIPFVLAAVPIDDWELELMPWSEPVVSKRPEVGSGAEVTLQYIAGELMPWLQQRYGMLPAVLGGYSLGGLFSLWAARRCDLFNAVAAASPSLWAGEWPQYADSHAMHAQCVYLSLGDREEHTKNKTMARSGDRIREEYTRLQQQLGMDATTLEWNTGGHFNDPAGRTGRAFAWCLQHMVKH